MGARLSLDKLFKHSKMNGSIEQCNVVAVRYCNLMDGEITDKVSTQDQIIDIISDENNNYWLFFDKYGNTYNEIQIGYSHKK